MRRFTPDDLDELIELRSDEEVIKYLGGRRLQNPEAIAKRLQFYIDCYEKFGFGMSAMIWKETGEMIGWSGLQPLGDSGEIELGYGLIKDFWRKGIGYECAQGWLKFGFETACVKRIVAVASPENTGSWRIMEKCGMHYEKTETHYGMECVFYVISGEEYFKNQEKAQPNSENKK
jgi:ribosomal-protein-alanine N-acetyltransferase